MSDTAASRSSRWWTVLLVASLAANLLIGGAMTARHFRHERMERIAGISNVHLVPRRFLSELPRERRLALLAVLRAHGAALKEKRDAAKAVAGQLADALDKEPHDVAAVQAVAQGFAASAHAVLDEGAAAALAMIALLTPEERLLLARHIRQRTGGGRKR